MRVLTRCLFTFFFAFNAVVVFAQSGGCKSEAVNQVNKVEARVVTFNVPSQNIVEALTTLAGQASCQLLFSYEVVDSLQSNEVVGRYTIQEALQILLTDTALSGRLTAHGVIVIGPINAFEKKQLRGRVMKSKKNLLASTIAFFVGSGMAPGVFAQADDAAAQRSQIDEIIVTASKRGAGQSIQDTAMAISALSGDTIEKRGLVGMDDYLRSLPGVSMQDRGASQNSVVIRGLGSDPQLEDSTVGIYFGETPITGLGSSSTGDTSGSADIKLVDIERIEVLRGPQGTLYGSGSMGGTVRVIPSPPDLVQTEGKVAAHYSQTGEQGGDNSMVQGVINVPLVEDTLAVRAVVYQFDNSGYIDNVAASQSAAEPHILAAIAGTGVVSDKSEVGGDQYSGFRLTTLWQATEELSVTLGYTQQEIEQDGFPEVNLNLMGDFQQVRVNTGPGGSESEFMGNEIDIINLTVEYDLGWASLSSSSSWVDYEATNNGDVSIFMFSPIYANIDSGNEVFIEELRLSSQLEGPLQFLVGLYYEDADFTSSGSFLWGGDPLLSDPSTPIFVTGQDGVTEQKALFGELTYNISEDFSATFGIRHFDYDQSFSQKNLAGTFVLLDESSTKQEDGQSYKFNLTYTPNDDILIYGQWAEGFRLGQAVAKPNSACDANNDNILDDVGFAAPDGVDSDTSESFEFGIKASLADNRVTINTAIYRINWEGMPISLSLASCGALVILNAGESKSEGVELEIQTLLTDNLRLDFSTSYGEAILTEDAENLGDKGDNLPGSSDFNASLGLEYGFTLAGRNAFTRADYTYLSEYYSNLAGDGTAAGGFSQVNIKAGIEFNAIEVNLYINNLTNADDLTWVESVFGGFSTSRRAYRLRPRTIGLNLAYRF